MAKFRNELTWSVSRDQLFAECRRAYYYQYYGSWGGWEDDAPEHVRKLYILKNIKTLAMWSGTIVHETIAEALNRYGRSEVVPRAAELQARARQKLRNGWKDAVAKAWSRAPKKTNLHELYYGNGKSLPQEQTAAAKERVYTALTAFADSTVLKEILAVPYMNWRPIDSLDSFSLDGLKVWCAIDFAYVDPEGKLRILDWKTGGERAEALRTQLACYALYAADKWFYPIENLRLYGVFLSDGARTSEYAISPEVIIEAKDRALTGAAEMRAVLMDVESNAAREDDFPGCDLAHTCTRCKFREVCPCLVNP